MQLFPRGKSAEQDIYKRLSYDPEDNTIMEEIRQARRDMEDAYEGFQNASDPDLIDAYIYESNAVWKRYSFLLKHLKPQ